MICATLLRTVAVLLAGAALVALAACGDDGRPAPSPGDTSFELTIGELYAGSGALSTQTPTSAKAVRLAVESARTAIRDAGADVSIRLRGQDTRSEAAVAVPAARRLVAGGSSCIVGPYGSQETLLVAQAVTTPQHVPIISPSATSEGINQDGEQDYLFRTAPPDRLQADVLASLAERVLGRGARISIGARGDAYGLRFVEQFTAGWERRGGQANRPVLYDLFGTNSADAAADARALTAPPTDGWLVVDFMESYRPLGRALVATGRFDARRLLVNDGLAEDRIPSSVDPASLDGAHGTRPAGPRDTPAGRAFARRFASGPGPRRPSTFAEHTFDATVLCVLAAIRAGGRDPERIAASIPEVTRPPGRRFSFLELPEAIRALRAGEEIDYDGVSGPLDLDDAGDPTRATYQEFVYRERRLVPQREVEAVAR